MDGHLTNAVCYFFVLSASLISVLSFNATCLTEFTKLNNSVTRVQCPTGCLAQSDRCDVLCGCPYHSEGPICLAAIHEGYLTDTGGLVEVYQASNASHQPQACSVDGKLYSFTMSCTTQGNIEEGVSTVTCPQGCSSEYFCGENVYSADSSICAAAINVGVITDSGGEVSLFKDTSATTCPSSNLFTFTGPCVGDLFTFPRENQKSDYIIIDAAIPNLTNGTFCFWTNMTRKVGSKGSFDILISYAVGSSDNELWLVHSWTHNTFRAHIGKDSNPYFGFGYVLPVEVNTHLCFWFNSVTQLLGLHVNGELFTTLSYTGSIVRGGGTMLLGQEQDTEGGKFSAADSYTGTFTNLIIYKRQLTAAEIYNIAHNCTCLWGNIVNVGGSVARGEAQIANSSPCPTV